MKLRLFLPIAALLLFTVSCKKKPAGADESTVLDSTQITGFFAKFPEYKTYEKELKELYKEHEQHYIWYDKNGRVDFAEVLYARANQLNAEGVPTAVPYKKQLDAIFDSEQKRGKPDVNDELLISSLYFFYTHKVYEGVDPAVSKASGWFLPRSKTSYVDYLDELMKDPDKIKQDESKMFSQYYNLKKGLRNLRAIREKGGWQPIDFPEGVKTLKEGDDNPAIAQIRKRLVASGDLKSDNGSTVFDSDLANGLASYQKKQRREGDKTIDAGLVKEMNIPVEQRIKTVIVNMERCRWIAPDIMDSKELIAVNIPSYRVVYYKDGKPALTSNVVVGKELNKTVVFSGQMSYIVFSPYWNIPKSIIEKEIKPGMDKDPDYLEKHNMEWNNGQVRQKPGNENSLGLIKFMFPNQNNIYLHDTPAKSLFAKDERALSHGCVRVQKARDLAVEILKGDKNWTPEKIDEAMHAGKEKYYTLKHKIPVYIAYLTAMADENGNVTFFRDIYDRDGRLAAQLYKD